MSGAASLLSSESPLPRPSGISVRVKLLSFVSIGIILVVLVQAWLNFKSAQEQTETLVREQLVAISNDFQHDVDSYAVTVLAVANSIADRKELIRLMQESDREGLLALLTPLFHTLRDRYNLGHLYVHDPLGNVIVRIHNPDQYGDNIAEYRHTAADAIRQLQPTVGIELGPNFLGLRGVVPLQNDEQLVGLVEVGMDFDKNTVHEFKSQNSADYTLWLTNEIAQTVGYRLKGDELPSSLESIFFYQSTLTDALPIAGEDYQAALNGDVRYHLLNDKGVTTAVLLKRLLGYGERTFGILQISQPIQAAIDTMHQDQIIIGFIAVGLIIVSLTVLGMLLTRLILHPLRILTNAAQKQLAGDLKVRVTPLGNDEFGQLGQTFNELTSNLSGLIDGQKADALERERLQQQVIEAQKQAIRDLSAPVIPILDHIIVMPLIGGIDTNRARDITRALLVGIGEHRARIAILDVTGVPIVDSGVADHLNRTIQAARLKGTQTIVTGISEAVAETIVDLGIDWSGIRTIRDLQTGLQVALDDLRRIRQNEGKEHPEIDLQKARLPE